jgi:hypothetical protein
MTSPPRDTTQIDGVIFGLPMALLALAILLCAGPTLATTWSSLSVQSRLDPQTRYEAVARGIPASDPDLAALGRTLRQSDVPANVARAAQVQLIRAQMLGVTSVRAQQLATQAVRDLKQSLAVAPSDTHAWMRLAVAHHLLQDQRAAAQALAMSLRTGKSDPALMSMQFDLAVVVWDGLVPAARNVIARHLANNDQLSSLPGGKESHAVRVLRARLDEATHISSTQTPLTAD